MSLDVISSVVVPAGRDAGSPCLTYLDPASGERTELSGRTVALWVAKTANLIQDELGLEPGDVVALRLPAHWQAWTWLFGAWLAGCVVDVTEAGTGPVVPADADVAVVPLAALAAGGGDVANSSVPLVSLALRPMALPGPPPPAGVLDFDTAVRVHGDRYTARPGVPPGRLRAAGREVAWTDLLDGSAGTNQDGDRAAGQDGHPAAGQDGDPAAGQDGHPAAGQDGHPAAGQDGPGRRLLTTLAPAGLEAVTTVVRALAAGSGVVLLAPGPAEDPAGTQAGTQAGGPGPDPAGWTRAAAKALAGEAVTRSTPECRHLLT